MSKSILIVSRSFYPMNSPRSFRTTELVKEFSRQGHEVTLLTSRDEAVHSRFEKEYGVTIRDFGKLRFSSVDPQSENRVAGLFKRAIRRGMKLFFEYPDIELSLKIRKALNKETGYDLLISIAAPHPVHWGVAAAWRKKNPIAKTWVADCGDPYMGATLDSFRKLFYFQYLEKWFCRTCHYITVPIENAREGYYPEYRDKIRVIPQGFNFNGVEIEREAYSGNPVPTFAYAGGFIPGGRDPREFLSYLVESDRKFKFILYTKSTALVEPFIKKAAGRIEIRDYIPRKELLQTLAGMDFLVNFENSTSLQMPSKLIDYYLTGRPVLSVGSTDIDKQAINRFLNGDYRDRYRYENVDQYRIENVCSRFLELSNKNDL